MEEVAGIGDNYGEGEAGTCSGLCSGRGWLDGRAGGVWSGGGKSETGEVLEKLEVSRDFSEVEKKRE